MASELAEIALWAKRLRGVEPVSIGWNCSTAYYLRAVGMRNAAYPFDWTFSSPAIVADAIRRRFDDFIDPTQLTNIEGSNGAGHRRYHRGMFAHAHPTASSQIKASYQRRIDRFLELFDGPASICFVASVLPEIAKRRGWSEGFTQDFPLPDTADLTIEFADLVASVKARMGETFFVTIIQHTEQRARSIDVIDKNANSMIISFNGIGGGGGLRFDDDKDDALFRGLYTALFNS